MESKTFRRFIQIGTDEKMNRLSDLVESKGLSRDDLILILGTVKLMNRLSDLVESKGLSRDDLILILETIKLNHDIFL